MKSHSIHSGGILLLTKVHIIPGDLANSIFRPSNFLNFLDPPNFPEPTNAIYTLTLKSPKNKSPPK